MKSPVKKALMQSFAREFAEKFPQFAPFDADSDQKTWSWKLAPDLRFFVMLQAFPRLDQFAVELCWSRADEFPFGGFGWVNVDEPQGRVRLSRLWASSGDEPIWDVSPEKTAREAQDLEAIVQGRDAEIPPDPPLKQLLPRIQLLVTDAIGKLDEYGMPFFRRVAEAHGKTMN